MTDLQVFDFPESDGRLRVISADASWGLPGVNAGDPLFVTIDITEYLGMGGAHYSTRLLDDDEHFTLDARETGLVIPLGLTSRNPKISVLTEAGMYSLILRSRKAIAKRFKRWITHEVLPTIRKTGRYEVEAADAVEPFPIPRTLPEALRLAAEIEERRLEAEARADAAEAEVERVAPVVQGVTALMVRGEFFTVTEAAQWLRNNARMPRLGRNRLYELMGTNGWAYRDRLTHKWVPMQDKVDRGWLKSVPNGYFTRRSTGERIATERVVFTMAGLLRFQRELEGQNSVLDWTTRELEG